VPADRFFNAAPEVLDTLKSRVTANALELARNGVPKQPFYLTGQVGGQPFSLHAEGERVILTGASGGRREIDLTTPAQPTPAEIKPAAAEVRSAGSKAELPPALCPMGVVTAELPEGAEPPDPGTSPLDNGLRQLEKAFGPEPVSEGGES